MESAWWGRGWASFLQPAPAAVHLHRVHPSLGQDKERGHSHAAADSVLDQETGNFFLAVFTGHSPFSCSFSTQRPSILFWRCPLFRADQRNLQVPPTLICLQFMPVTPFTQLSFVCQKANNSDPEFYLEKLSLKKEALKYSSSSVKTYSDQCPCFHAFPLLPYQTFNYSVLYHSMYVECLLPALYSAGCWHKESKNRPSSPSAGV